MRNSSFHLVFYGWSWTVWIVAGGLYTIYDSYLAFDVIIQSIGYKRGRNEDILLLLVSKYFRYAMLCCAHNYAVLT